MNNELSDHEMIFVQEKKKQTNKLGDHEQISFKFFKNYSIDDVKYKIYNIII